MLLGYGKVGGNILSFCIECICEPDPCRKSGRGDVEPSAVEVLSSCVFDRLSSDVIVTTVRQSGHVVCE